MYTSAVCSAVAKLNAWRLQEWRAVELFAGTANLTFALKNLRYKCIKLDYDYGGRHQDLLTPAGMACLVCYILRIHCADMSFCSTILVACLQVRLAVAAVLRLQPCGLLVLAPVCSSFSDMCVSQSCRSIVLPLGDQRYSWVKSGNLLAHRRLA